MKSASKHLWFNTDQPREYINITEEVANWFRTAGSGRG